MAEKCDSDIMNPIFCVWLADENVNHGPGRRGQKTTEKWHIRTLKTRHTENGSYHIVKELDDELKEKHLFILTRYE